jgi:uncharacterized protein (DUF58 family)
VPSETLKHKSIFFFTNRTYFVFGFVVAWIVLTALLPSLFFYVGLLGLVIIAALILLDYLRLKSENSGIIAERKISEVLSLGENNEVVTSFKHSYPFDINVKYIDDLPEQLQLRRFRLSFIAEQTNERLITYSIRPTSRGIYHFGNMYFYVRTSKLGLLERRFEILQETKVNVYPSVIQMREIELKSFSKLSVNQGMKRIRRLGHSYEFEQIKTYVEGDDYRSINWKATGRHQDLMINQYEDERSQPVYFIIDKGRNMKMPFHGLSLVDYAINSSLAICNVALKKGDKVGLITFDKEVESFIKAGDKRGQLATINDTLFNLQQSDVESGFDALYAGVGHYVKQRSLLFIFTNCHTLHSLKRIKPALQLMNRTHLVVVILFENTEIAEYAKRKANDLEQVYENTIAEEFLFDQRQIAAELNTNGIQTIVSAPNELSVNTVNKYLELKSQGRI